MSFYDIMIAFTTDHFLGYTFIFGETRLNGLIS